MGEDYSLYLFHQGVWKRCLYAMELYALRQDMHKEGHHA
jgi:hypothetical protein